ncbi:unnamed protein product [Didymodactylos carnosus]|uniref:EGF-like domain-containing protein n=1 Tax=Didymodactylos carnosus TaxID=1234261 RepID=A0A814ZSW9_9BILA|nr:unnamed protein product [Didymodactylos carnosus]CAF4011803.1 unnamed protein product [Didymodactylos carnosus]
MHKIRRPREEKLPEDFGFKGITATDARALRINAWSLVPYCIRSSSYVATNENDFCHGQNYTFEELHQHNITSTNLYYWNAPMDVINPYEKYQNPEQLYCNCSKNWFGKYCQYTLHSDKLFSDIIIQRFQQKKLYSNKISPSLTCYRELNECDRETEFRCKNGMCIEKDFSYDRMYDCMDRSDEQDSFADKYQSEYACYRNPSLDCEEYQCSWMTYSCGDGQCNSLAIGEESTYRCYSGRTYLNTKSFFNSSDKYENEESLCRHCWICSCTSTTFRDMYLNLTTAMCKTLLVKKTGLCHSIVCQGFILHPKPVMYPNVQFMYTSQFHELPTYICYERSKCPNLNFLNVTILRENLTCAIRTEFHWLSSRSYNSFFTSVHKTFSDCSIENNYSSCTHPLSFQCKHSQRCISFHRVKDGITDCTFINDENEDVDICQLNLTDHFQCSLIKSNCIHRKHLFDNKNHCKDKSDVIAPFKCKTGDDLGCQILRGFTLPVDYFLFQEICNDYPHPELNNDDESDCEEWKQYCSLKYTRCDGVLNCLDGHDEFDCEQKVSRCKTAVEIPCISPKTFNIECLSQSRVNDRHIDCMGSADELKHCSNEYPNELTRRYRCLNDSKCIDIERICDGYYDCQFHDDEDICPNRPSSDDNIGMLVCGTENKVISKDLRCDGINQCGASSYVNSYDEWFCELIKPQRLQYKLFSIGEYSQYPPIANAQYEYVQQSLSNQLVSSNEIIENDDHSLYYYCNRGILLSLTTSHSKCLCPPSYTGDRCQYQTNRLSIYLQIETPLSLISTRNTIYRLLVRLQSQTNLFHDFVDEIYHVPYNQTIIYKHIFYLIVPKLYEQYSVVIDIFDVSSSKNIQFHSSWYYPLQFSFLPVRRLTIKLILNRKSEQCNDKSALECGLHGICMTYANNLHQHYFCLCNQSWSGEFCNTSTVTVKACFHYSLSYHSLCICPLGRFGNECYAQIDLCQNVQCLNESFFGNRCQYSAAQIKIGINNLWTNDHSIIKIPLVVVHLANITDQIGLASIHDRFIYSNVEFGTTILTVYRNQLYLPTFVYVQLYFNTHRRSSYHLVSFSKYNVRSTTTNILESNRCPYVGELLNSTIMSFNYLKRIKFYYRPCLILGTKCFFDEKYICLCDNEGFLDCFLFDHQASNCIGHNYCLNGGECVQPVHKYETKMKFVCVCPPCYYGELCQFSTTKYSMTMDALLGQIILTSKNLHQQPLIIKRYL